MGLNIHWVAWELDLEIIGKDWGDYYCHNKIAFDPYQPRTTTKLPCPTPPFSTSCIFIFSLPLFLSSFILPLFSFPFFPLFTHKRLDIFFLFSLSKWNHDSVVQFCITKSQFCCVAQLLHNRIVICCVICYTTQWNRITLSFYIF